ncbi:UNVERIFIED_CONTAM: hypothetical protein GTU68_019859 [Idotea baltica]|nr:hypothetical protein [Idotea baltica]
MEIERKWLVETLPDLSKARRYKIIQGYISIAENGDEVRLRKKDNLYFQTIKSKGGLVRSEVEIKLTEEQFNTLWPTTEDKRIVKTRYEIPINSLIAEVDIYKENLEGLKIVEVEFSTIEEAELFSFPNWFGKEVTEDEAYKNKNLAVKKD